MIITLSKHFGTFDLAHISTFAQRILGVQGVVPNPQQL
jgi:hypothetical protein